MAVFVAHVTSVLTSYTLEQDDVTIKGKKVGRQRERSAPPPLDLARSPLKNNETDSVLWPENFFLCPCTEINKVYVFSTTMHEPLLQWIFFVLSFLLLFSSDFRCVTVPVFVILLFTCLFFIFLNSFYCLNFWTFNSRAFYSGWYSSADYNTKSLSC